MTPKAAVPELSEKELQQEGTLVVQEISSIKIVDQSSYDKVSSFLTGHIKPFLKKCDEFFDKNIAKAHELHHSLLQQKKSVTNPVLEVEKNIKRQLITWSDKVEAEQAEADKKALEAQAKAHQEQAIAEAVEAEQAGASKEEVETILSQPNFAPMPIAAPLYRKAAGVSIPCKWKGEVTNLKELCKAIGEGKAPVNCVIANQSVLNALCNANREASSIPGVKAYPDKNVSAKSSR